MPAGEARFVSLAEIMRSRAVTMQADAPAESPASNSTAPQSSQPPSPGAASPTLSAPTFPAMPSGEHGESAAAVREARLFRAALADMFDAVAADLVRDLAADVLGRELLLAPVDVEMLARRLIAERHADEPLRLRVCPADAHIACELPVVADPRLQAGDAVLVCSNGEIDARLSVRLAHVLATVTT